MNNEDNIYIVLLKMKYLLPKIYELYYKLGTDIDMIVPYIKFYNKLASYINRIVSKTFLKHLSESDFVKEPDIMQCEPPKKYIFKEINCICDTYNQTYSKYNRYKYVDGLDILIYRKVTKIKEEILAYIYHSSLNGNRVREAYNIWSMYPRLNYKEYFAIETLFKNNPNIYYIRGVLTIDDINMYKKERLFIHIINNTIINLNVKLYYHTILDYDMSMIAYTISGLNKLDLSINGKFIVNNFDIIFLANYKTCSVKKIVLDKSEILYLPYLVLSDNKMYPIYDTILMTYYTFNNNVYVYNNNTIFTHNINISRKHQLNKYPIHNYKIYSTKSPFIIFCIRINVYDSIYNYLKSIDINFDTEMLPSGIDKVLNNPNNCNSVFLKKLSKCNIQEIISYFTPVDIPKNIHYNGIKFKPETKYVYLYNIIHNFIMRLQEMNYTSVY